MTEERRIAVCPITPEDAAAYGQVVSVSDGQPFDNAGDGWGCWYPVGELNGAAPLLVGIVQSDPRPLVIEALECHADRQEWVYALDQAMIQVVAHSAPGGPSRPDAQTARAFLLQPGQGLIMAPGVWHAVGLPAGECSIRYGFVLGKPDPNAPADENPWVPFARGARLVLVRE